MKLTIEHQRIHPFRSVLEVFPTERQAKFEGHIEARQIRSSVEFGARDVMKAEIAETDQIDDLVQASIAGVRELQRTAWSVSASQNRKGDRCKEGLVIVVERTVNEDLFIRTWLRCTRRGCSGRGVPPPRAL